MYVADCYIHVKYRALRPNEFEWYSEIFLEVATTLVTVVKLGKELDYTFEEGTLLQRTAVIGGLALGGLDIASRYHDLRESIIDAIRDQHTLSTLAIDKFHELTKTTPADDIYKRVTSRDMNRLNRIITIFDQIEAGNVPHSELPRIRKELIHDLAGLARANPNDPEIAKLMRLLPEQPIPDLPRSPTEAILAEEHEWERKEYPFLEQHGEAVEHRPIRPRRQYHTRISIPR